MDRLLAFVFLSFLVLPVVLRGVQGPRDEDIRREGRMPASFPDAAWASLVDGRFSRAFEDWFSDAQGGRTALIRTRNLLWWFALGQSPTPDMVAGEDGWIFTTKRDAIDVFRGLMPLSLRELEELRTYIERRVGWCRERGIEALVVIAPNKHSIYSERLPGRLTRHGPTRLDQLLDHMRERSSVPLHDFRTVLLAETARDQSDVGDFTYHPLGTHWTDRGARAACGEIVGLLGRALAPRFPGFRPLPDDRFVRKSVAQPGDSLAERLHLQDHLTQAVWTVTPRPRRAGVEEQDFARHTTVPDEGLPDAVVIHDSFGFALWPILAESFHRGTFLSVRGADDRTIEARHPDVVVMVIAERNLTGLPDFWPLGGRAAAAGSPGN